MKHISKLFALLAIMVMAAACSSDVKEIIVPLNVANPTVYSVNGFTHHLSRCLLFYIAESYNRR